MIKTEPDKTIIIYEDNYVQKGIEYLDPGNICKLIKSDDIIALQYIESPCKIFAILSERSRKRIALNLGYNPNTIHTPPLIL